MAEYHTISDNDIASMMHKAGVRPSVQRIAIMSFVGNSRLHPSAEEIYRHLHEAMPSLSRTTVYNSLHTLAQLSLIRELEIEPGMTRYDLAVQAPHAHFRCRKCGRIIDVPLVVRANESIPGFQVDSVDVFYKGICLDCNRLTDQTT